MERGSWPSLALETDPGLQPVRAKVRSVKSMLNEDSSVEPRTIGLCGWFVLNESSTERRALGCQAQDLVAERRVSPDGLRLNFALKFYFF